jgi:hypothetical protein
MYRSNGEPFDEWWAALPDDLQASLLADPGRELTDDEYLAVSRYDLHAVYRAEFPGDATAMGWRLRTPVQDFVRFAAASVQR